MNKQFTTTPERTQNYYVKHAIQSVDYKSEKWEMIYFFQRRIFQNPPNVFVSLYLPPPPYLSHFFPLNHLRLSCRHDARCQFTPK